VIVAHTRNSSSAEALLLAVQSKPANFFAHAVRNIELNFFPSKAFPWDAESLNSDDGWSEAELFSVLHWCTGVIDLALIGDLSDHRLLSILAHMRPTHLTLAADITSNLPNPPHFDVPIFENVTHLHLFDADVDLFDADSSVLTNWSYWSEICGLSALTHLAFPCQTPNDILPVVRPAQASGSHPVGRCVH
jgi:hypothetical protein